MSADSPHPRWPSAEEFYAEDPRREHSIETRLPGAWLGEEWTETYELYWLKQTGEIAAIASAAYRPAANPIAAATGETRPVELIGWAETEDQARRAIDGWASHHSQLKSLYWLRRKLRTDGPGLPPDRITEDHREQAAGGSLF